MSVTIRKVSALEILDSRGNPTVAVELALSDGSIGSASVPSGASTGEHEAIELRDGDSNRYRGKGVQKAVSNVNTVIAPALQGKDPFQQSSIDSLLLELDGTRNKGKLGANAILGVSLAVAHAAAASQKKGLYQYLGNGNALPVPLVNVINGGAHANNNLDVQEFMLVPHGFNRFSDAMRAAAEVFHSLGALLSDDGYETGVGDEGGYAPRLESMEEAFEFLLRAVEKSGYKPGEQISLALDVAASEFVTEKNGEIHYKLAKSSGKTLSLDQFIELYQTWCNTYPLVSIEDPLGENDWNGWQKITNKLGANIQLVGDDLFVTNTEFIRRGIEQNTANSVLIKLNQIGTVTETIAAIKMAHDANYTAIVSHRSGETSDTTIADLSVALNTGQIKTGSMCRGERTAKYNRLLWIEKELGENAQFNSAF